MQLLLEHLEVISPDKKDTLHELLEDLGDVPDVESMLGTATPAYANNDVCSLVVASGFTECRCLCFQAKEPWAQTTRTRRAPSASWPRPTSPSLSPASLSCWTETTKT